MMRRLSRRFGFVGSLEPAEIIVSATPGMTRPATAALDIPILVLCWHSGKYACTASAIESPITAHVGVRCGGKSGASVFANVSAGPGTRSKHVSRTAHGIGLGTGTSYGC